MITPNEYGNAIETLLNGAFPGEKVYREIVPEDFERPSNEIECASFSAAQTSADAVDVTVQMIVRTFVTVDAYHNSQFSALYRRAMTVLGLFVRGYLPVSDPDTGEKRAPKVTALGCPITGKDYAEIHLTCSIQVNAADLRDADNPGYTPPPMERVHISYE